MQASQKNEVIQYLHPLIQSALFGQVANALQLFAVEFLAEEPDLAFIGDVDANHHADRRRLAGAVRTEQAIHASFANVERQVIDGDEAVVGLVYSAEFDGVGHSFSETRDLAQTGQAAWCTDPR